MDDPLLKMISENQDEDLEGCFNPEADKHDYILDTWSDTNLDGTLNDEPFRKLSCRNCQGEEFEVFCTDDYETSARCKECKMWYIVHTG